MTTIADAAIVRRRSRQWPPLPWSMTMIGAVGSIPPSPPLTMTVANKDQLAKERWVSTINAGQGHHRIHPTAASVDDDPH